MTKPDVTPTPATPPLPPEVPAGALGELVHPDTGAHKGWIVKDPSGLAILGTVILAVSPNGNDPALTIHVTSGATRLQPGDRVAILRFVQDGD